MKKLYSIPIILCIMLAVFTYCTRDFADNWFDDGEKYLCPDCQDKIASELAPCVRCFDTDTPYNYCYDCAKELNCCQLCYEAR